MLSKGKINEVASKPKDTVRYVKINDPTQQQDVYIEHHFDEEHGVGGYWLAIVKEKEGKFSLSEYRLGTAGFKEEYTPIVERKSAVISATAKNSLDRAHLNKGLINWLGISDSYIDKASPRADDFGKVELQGIVDFSSRLIKEGKVQSAE